MQLKVPSGELADRLARFRAQMDTDNPNWELSAIFGNINLYYLTGTMQDGVLLIPRDEEAVFWVRKSFERAARESEFPVILQMKSYRDAAQSRATVPDQIFIETNVVTVSVLQRFQKYFPCDSILSLDAQIGKVRSIKSRYELNLLEQAGEIHRTVLEDRVPDLLREGMSEAEFARDMYSCMIDEGHHGVVRFGMFNTEILGGQIGFGESSIYPTSFDGPGGAFGMCPAVPTFGSRERKLRSGDLVFADTACGVDGYHTDKTQTYMFGRSLREKDIEIHRQCVDIEHAMAAMLKPGVSPSEIFGTIMDGSGLPIPENFMGFGDRRASFLGHGVGLLVDEVPIITRGFDEPLQEGMVLALEPKAGIKDVGMVGIEDTFLVTPSGGRSITGTNPGLIPVY